MLCEVEYADEFDRGGTRCPHAQDGVVADRQCSRSRTRNCHSMRPRSSSGSRASSRRAAGFGQVMSGYAARPELDDWQRAQALHWNRSGASGASSASASW